MLKHGAKKNANLLGDHDIITDMVTLEESNRKAIAGNSCGSARTWLWMGFASDRELHLRF